MRLSGALWWVTNREGLLAGARGLSAFTGLPEAALTGAGWLAAVAPPDRAALNARWQAALTARAPLVTACRFLRPHGAATWLSAQCAPITSAGADEEPRWLWLATRTAQERAVGAMGYYRALFHQQGQGVALIDAQGAPLRVNAAALEMLGLSLAQARGAAETPAGWRITREDGTVITSPFAEIASATASGEATHVYWQVMANGWPVSHWLSVTASPIIRVQAHARSRSLIILTDVTEQTLKRLAIQSLAQQTTAELVSLRAALDRMTDAFVALDYTGRFTYLNARAREQFEPPDEPLLGKRFWEIFPSLAGGTLETEFRHILRERTPRMVEVMLGEESWYEFRAYPAEDGVSVYIRDITAQKRTMAELDAALTRERAAHNRAEERAQELNAIFEAVGDAVLVFGADGSTLRANHAMRNLAAALGRKLELPLSAERVWAGKEIISPDIHTDSHESPLRRILAGETLTGERTVDIGLRATDGRHLYLNISGAPIRGSDGAILGAVESLRDVTSKREAERERSRTMNLVAHELRTPLAAIKLSLDLSLRRAARGLSIDAPTLAVAASSCLQLEHIVNDLVDAAHAERRTMVMEMLPCDAGELASQAIAEQRAATNRVIRFDPPKKSLPIVADAARIRQVFSNLLANAIKYAPPETPVTLRIERRAGNVVWAGVSDEGPGVSAEAQPHLFEPFYRAPDAERTPGASVGLGLGLFLCKRIIDLHGGQIGVRNRPERGSLFWFTLPLAEPTAEP